MGFDRVFQVKARRIYVLGASGSGTTTLGAALAANLGVGHVDADDHYWAPVDPPFSVKRSEAERVGSINAALGDDGWVLSGSCHGWADIRVAEADLVVFVTVPTEDRLARLRAREEARFGDRIAPGGDMHAIHTDFMDWAAGYDVPGFDGRSRERHEDWIKTKSGVCRVDGLVPVEESVARVLPQLPPVVEEIVQAAAAMTCPGRVPGVFGAKDAPDMLTKVFTRIQYNSSIGIDKNTESVWPLSHYPMSEELYGDPIKVTLPDGSERMLSAASVFIIGDFGDFDTWIAITSETPSALIYLDPGHSRYRWYQSPISATEFAEWLGRITLLPVTKL